MASQRFDSFVAGTPAVFGGSVVARGLEGHSTNDHGVVGVTFGPGTGVFGVGTKGRGVEGESTDNHAIVGTSKGIGTGVFGVGKKGRGVEGESTENHAIVGTSKGKGAGVFGTTDEGNGLEGRSNKGIGVFAVSTSGEAAIRGDHRSGGFAGVFNGNVHVSGQLTSPTLGGLLQRIDDLEKQAANVRLVLNGLLEAVAGLQVQVGSRQ
jgi:hypothetical protein